MKPMNITTEQIEKLESARSEVAPVKKNDPARDAAITRFLYRPYQIRRIEAGLRPDVMSSEEVKTLDNRPWAIHPDGED